MDNWMCVARDEKKIENGLEFRFCIYKNLNIKPISTGI